MTSAHALTTSKLVTEEQMSVDKCDCALDHPAHRDQRDGQGSAGHWAWQLQAVDEGARR
jgi:hypothetical protein